MIPPFADSYVGPPVPVNPTNGTTPVGPTNPERSSIKQWFRQYGLYVAIAGGVIIFVLLVVLSWVCYKKTHKPDPYMNKTYTLAEEEEIKLDEDRKTSNEALNESKGDFNNDYQSKFP